MAGSEMSGTPDPAFLCCPHHTHLLQADQGLETPSPECVCATSCPNERPPPPGPAADSLLNANLPVQLLDDGGPVDLPVYSLLSTPPKMTAPPSWRALLAAECKAKGESGSGCGKGREIEVLPWLQTGAPEVGLSPLRLRLLRQRCVSPQTGAPWRLGCVSPQTGAS